MKYKEIERKWLLDAFPAAEPQSVVLMEQGYLVFDPTTVRIRKMVCEEKTDYRLTIKKGHGLVRTEVELPLQQDEYQALLPLAIVPPVKKQMQTYRLPGGEILECSLVDEGEATSFYYAEVEFESEEAACAFTPPAFLGREVTSEHGWTMAAYCRRKGKQ